MKNLTDYFCNINQSMLLKKVGFNEKCFMFYNLHGKLKRYMNGDLDWNDLELQTIRNSDIKIHDTYTAPLKTQVINFFREKYEQVEITSHSKHEHEYFIKINENISFLSNIFETYEETENKLIDKLLDYYESTFFGQ